MYMPTLADIFDGLTIETTYTPPKHWLQGRTAYGGFSAALALQIALKEFPEGLPPLKSAQIAFIGPVTENVTFHAEILRQGKSATQIAVDARVHDALVLRTAFIFAAPRKSTIQHNHIKMPQVDRPEAYLPPPEEMFVPDFFDNFSVRFVSQSTPVSNSEKPELLAWVRLNDTTDISPEVTLLIIGDCLPPASMACFKTPAPISSMNWSVDFAQSAKHSEWYLLKSFSLISDQGYSYQMMHVWNEKGELVLSGTQTVAIFA